uniref:CCR4-NOT transcription complex subunit 6-like-B isoform X2 n=1 Tax=Myxine glutinosa TaxID=7769 RepID=UPI00358E9A2B
MPKEDYEPPDQRRVTIMSLEEHANGKRSHWAELEITGRVKSLSMSLWSLTHLTTLHLNDNNLSRIPPDISRLQNLSFLDLSSNKLRSLPAEIGTIVTLRELLLNHNLLRVLPFELGKLFQLHKLGLKGNPLPQEILGLYHEHDGTRKLLTFMLDNLAVQPEQPPSRPWIPLANPDRSQTTAVFTVMSYNVLCDKYATRQLYGYCPSWALSWEYRKKGIMQEILHCSADIISLQALETEQFYNFFLPELKVNGYNGIFSSKSRARTMMEHERKYVDGCAVFFKTNRFMLVKEHLVEFNQLAMAHSEGSEAMLNRVMTKDNIGVAVLLEVKDINFLQNQGMPLVNGLEGRQTLLVANAHIHWDPEFSDVKLIQTMMFLSELKTFAEEASRSLCRVAGLQHPIDSIHIPLVLCADLNSLPDSGVVEYLSAGGVSENHKDLKELAYNKCLTNFNCNGKGAPGGFITHPFKLNSAYESDIMPYTNYTYDFKVHFDVLVDTLLKFLHQHQVPQCFEVVPDSFRLIPPIKHVFFHSGKLHMGLTLPHPGIPEFLPGMIDYIFFSKPHIGLLGVLGPLDPHWLDENSITGCPHPHIPSDHFSLLAELELLPSSTFLPIALPNGIHLPGRR